jgi:hypothetical protein
MARKKVGRTWGAGVQNTSKPVDTSVNILLWGATGVGKTRFISTCDRPFIIAAEKGLMTITGSGIPYYALDPDYEIYNTVVSILESARRREKILDSEGNLLVDFAEIDTIAIDSASALSSLIVAEIEDQLGRPMQLQDWGIARSRQSAIDDLMIMSPFNYVVTSGEAIKDDLEDPTKVRATLNMQGSYKDMMPYKFDFNIYMSARPRGRTLQYIAQTQNMNKRTAKSRAELPSEIENLDFITIKKAVEKKLQKGETK